jgi:replicative DNA helicase
MNDQLSQDFLVELLKSCLLSKETLDVVKPHLQYSFLPTEAHKELYKFTMDYHTKHGKPPTIGLLSQKINTEEGAELIEKVRQSNVYDSKDQILEEFEIFVKKNKFVQLYNQTGELYDEGKHAEAMQMLADGSKEINNLSLKSLSVTRVFGGFKERQAERSTKDYAIRKIPTGIPPLDYHTHGGPEKGTATLVIARSGVGKSTDLRWKGYSAAMRGFNVLHFQAEGKKQEVVDAYDSMWTGVELHEMKRGSLGGADWGKIEKAHKSWLSQAGEIYIHAFEQFHAASIADCRRVLIDLLKTVKIDIIIFDYLEKFEPGDGKKYGTNQDGVSSRKLAVAEKIVNIATEFDVVCHTATQASNIKKENWNNPNWVITREDISNLKATIDPFAYCYTLNQTLAENDNEVMRIHEEKLRHYQIKSWEQTFYVAQQRNVGRFVDLTKTYEKYWDKEQKRVIKVRPDSSSKEKVPLRNRLKDKTKSESVTE